MVVALAGSAMVVGARHRAATTSAVSTSSPQPPI
jgi:hypothetical protein